MSLPTVINNRRPNYPKEAEQKGTMTEAISQMKKSNHHLILSLIQKEMDSIESIVHGKSPLLEGDDNEHDDLKE